MEKAPILLAEELGIKLCAAHLQLAVAESCTGGGLAYYLTAVPGSSLWFDRGFVTYSNASKQDLLAVPEAVLIDQGAVSEATAKAMLVGIFSHSSADLALSITGIAGPGGGSIDKPVGTVWFAYGRRGETIYTSKQQFSGERAAVRLQAIEYALNQLLLIFVQ